MGPSLIETWAKAMGELVLMVALVLCATACGRPYAGETRAQAVRTARVQWTEIAIVAGALAPQATADIKGRVSATKPRVSRAKCGTNEVWKVAWPTTFPIFVGKDTGPLWGRSARNCS